ncbi:hypothetical protein FD754_006106 [Muntiacus muntjak]|uniref:Carbonyl reductase (NADPH) n=1 Tax=Muntiacus muntjak TaxID=9888 RepID=A0A5N3WJK5_MUNMU|nr:hypothetical protein FD754_006106 [Muntiacus muntjak]
MSSIRVALVTGANKGLGFAITRDLCRRFPGDVVLTARDEARGRAAVQQLQAEGLSPRFHQLDIDDLQSIRTVRDFLRKEYGGLDVLVNNAGIAFPWNPCPSRVSSFLSKLTAPPKNPEVKFKPLAWLVEISEELVGLMNKFVEDTKNGVHRKEGWPNTAYGVTKIGVIVLSRIQTRKLSEQRGGNKILLNACCPGWMRTNTAGPKAPKSPEEEAETLVYLALLPLDAEGPHGEFVSEKKVVQW